MKTRLRWTVTLDHELSVEELTNFLEATSQPTDRIKTTTSFGRVRSVTVLHHPKSMDMFRSEGGEDSDELAGSKSIETELAPGRGDGDPFGFNSVTTS